MLWFSCCFRYRILCISQRTVVVVELRNTIPKSIILLPEGGTLFAGGSSRENDTLSFPWLLFSTLIPSPLSPCPLGFQYWTIRVLPRQMVAGNGFNTFSPAISPWKGESTFSLKVAFETNNKIPEIGHRLCYTSLHVMCNLLLMKVLHVISQMASLNCRHQYLQIWYPANVNKEHWRFV